MAKPHRILEVSYEHIRRDFSIASSRGDVIKDLFVCVDGTAASYKTVVNGITVYDGPSSAEAARKYNDPGKIRAQVHEWSDSDAD